MKPTIAVDHEKQLLLLRDLTARMGVIHEAQQLQLKMYPLIMITSTKTAESHLNIKEKTIDINITVDKKKNPDIQKQYQMVNEAIKWLLGPDWLVRIKIRNKTVFRGARDVALRLKEDKKNE